MRGLTLERLIFIFFSLGFAGWLAETINESVTRKKFVNKGFFKGPYVPLQGIGGIGVYAIGVPLKASPLLVFAAGAAACTVLEYAAAIFLEKCFAVRCWDYRTYPHTRWCHFRGRIALTTSVFFGLVTLFVVYLYWDFAAGLAARMGRYIRLADAALCVLFAADVVYSCAGTLRAKKAGIKITGWNVFSHNDQEAE